MRRPFCRSLNVPGYMNGAGRGTLRPANPLHFQLTRRDAFADADVIVIVGTPFDFRLRYGKSVKAPTVVQIDMNYAHVGNNRDIALGIAGDVDAILAAVTQAGPDGEKATSAAPRRMGFGAAQTEEAAPKRGCRCARDQRRFIRIAWRMKSTGSSPTTRFSSVTAATS